MIGVEIPKKDMPIFQELMDFDEAQFLEVIDVVNKLPIELNPSNLYSLLKETTVGNRPDIADVLFKILFSFVRQENVSVNQIVKLLYNSFTEQGGNVNGEKQFFDRFSKLLHSSDAIETAYKVLNLKRSSENYVQNQSLSLNIKPIFTGENEDKLSGNVLMYNFEITYFDNEIYSDEEKVINKKTSFTLDREAISHLKELIEIVEKQGNTLMTKLSKINLKTID